MYRYMYSTRRSAQITCRRLCVCISLVYCRNLRTMPRSGRLLNLRGRPPLFGPIAYCRHSKEQYSTSGAILAIFHFRSNIRQNHAYFVSSIDILYYCSMILNAISCLSNPSILSQFSSTRYVQYQYIRVQEWPTVHVLVQ